MPSDLTAYVKSGNWYNLYTESEIGEALNFLYNLLSWMERDNADILVHNPKEFIWHCDGEKVGEFPLTIPEPKPSFQDLITLMLKKDIMVNSYLKRDKNDANRYIFECQN